MTRTSRAPAAPDVSIVVPVYGCAGCLEALADRVRAALRDRTYELILVDDASPDGSWRRIVELAQASPHTRGLRLSRNFGQHAAISAGLAHSTGARVVVMDCDLQDAPEAIPTLLAKSDEGYDVVFASRQSRRDGWGKRMSSWAFHRTLEWLTGQPRDHTTANFGVFSRKVVDTLQAMPEANRCFPLLVQWTGFRSTTVAVAHAERLSGTSSYTLGRLARLALDIVLSYSDKPLRLVVKAGLAFAGLAFLVVIGAVVAFFAGDIRVAGYTSIIASIWLIGGVVLMSLGVVGLYVGRVFNQAKGRPAYLVDESTDDASD